jgi:Cu+-exporting ATPase
MTCANCVAAVERNLKKVEGVSFASVNLASERATVSFDPEKTDQRALVDRVRRAGYDIALGEADLLLRRLSDSEDARRLEEALIKHEGVENVSVNLAAERVRIRYIPTVVSQSELRQAVSEAGFEALLVEGETEDVERQAREREIRYQFRLLVTGLVFIQGITQPFCKYGRSHCHGLLGSLFLLFASLAWPN